MNHASAILSCAARGSSTSYHSIARHVKPGSPARPGAVIIYRVLTEPRPEAPDRARKVLRYMPIAIVIAMAYAGIVLFSRWSQTRDIEAKEKAKAAEERKTEEQRALDVVGGTEFNILVFYATPGLVHRGDPVELCYGVANAQTVKIEPDTGREVWPSVNRCIDLKPKKTTTYTLTAQDAHGNTKTAALTLEVH